MNYKIIALDFFNRKLKKLKKKYRNIKKDYELLLDTLEKDPYAGDAIKGCKNKIYKIRLKSSDMKRGKRGGFRVIYYLVDRDKKIYLLTIYAKTKKETISIKEIKDALKELNLTL
ncbi:MAG: type II toxin-antitoxin system RelE/ParE family toxin [Methanosarcinales archaeon]